jgi:hypothetical protein
MPTYNIPDGYTRSATPSHPRQIPKPTRRHKAPRSHCCGSRPGGAGSCSPPPPCNRTMSHQMEQYLWSHIQEDRTRRGTIKSMYRRQEQRLAAAREASSRQALDAMPPVLTATAVHVSEESELGCLVQATPVCASAVGHEALAVSRSLGVAQGETDRGFRGPAHLTPLGLFLNPLGLFLRTSIPFMQRFLSAFLRA